MKTINLINTSKSEISYKITKFPDGELHIVFNEEITHKDFYRVICRITSADELFILLQVGEILNRHGVEWELRITYLMSQRMDRVMTFNESFSLQIVANCINSLQCSRIYILSPHSRRALDLVHNSKESSVHAAHLTYGITMCYPDMGAYNRYTGQSEFKAESAIVIEKVRDVTTGKITGMKIEAAPDKVSNKIWIKDDLCDGGTTFIKAQELLKEKYPNASFTLEVTHAVNEEGLKKVCSIYDEVIITNSYKNWSYLNIPNLRIIDVCH